MTDDPAFPRPVETEHWTGVGAIALFGVALAVVVESRALLLGAVVGVGYAAYARVGEAPTPELAIDRELSETAPDPGDEVVVTVAVENVGDATLPDLRLVDGVPEALSVTDGPARVGTSLRPGQRVRFSYAVEAIRGVHEWEETRVIVRDLPGSSERSGTVADGAASFTCRPELAATADLPLRGLTTQYTGRVPTDVGGSGVEFHAVREYRHGDPLGRVDWNRLAATGELATREFREERAATVVIVVDARPSAYVAPDDESRNAVEHSVDAAALAASALLDAGDRVGLSAFAPDGCWLAPGAGSAHRTRLRETLATHPSLSPAPTDAGGFYPHVRLRELRQRLPPDAQLVVCTPLADDYVQTVVERLDAYGHLVTVISSDPSADETPGQRLARIERRERIGALRRSGIRVVDWGDRPLGVALSEAGRRWSA